MKVTTSTDGKYIGNEVPSNISIGDFITLGEFVLEVQFVRQLELNRICIGSPNYQLIIEA